jgi:tRNA threonylcarbamoyladenosine biosynthesis protein TsaB
MIILTIRTDKPEAEIGLYSDRRQIAYQKWQAHRRLAETIHDHIETMLKAQKKNWHDIKGIVCYQGPGSFTGLRIGLTVANALAAALEIPIIGQTSEDWLALGIDDLLGGKNDGLVLPEYGSPVHITLPKK